MNRKMYVIFLSLPPTIKNIFIYLQYKIAIDLSILTREKITGWEPGATCSQNCLPVRPGQ